MGSVVVAPELLGTGSIVVAQGLKCSSACRIFPDQGSNVCLLHYRQTLYHWATRETLGEYFWTIEKQAGKGWLSPTSTCRYNRSEKCFPDSSHAGGRSLVWGQGQTCLLRIFNVINSFLQKGILQLRCSLAPKCQRMEHFDSNDSKGACYMDSHVLLSLRVIFFFCNKSLMHDWWHHFAGPSAKWKCWGKIISLLRND